MPREALARTPAADPFFDDPLFQQAFVEPVAIKEFPVDRIKPIKELMEPAKILTFKRPLVSRVKSTAEKQNMGILVDASVVFEAKKTIMDFKDKNKDDLIMMARAVRDAAMRDADGCGGVNERGGQSTNNLFGNKNITLVGGTNKGFGEQLHGHSEGGHKHCEKHDKDDCHECAA